MSPDRLEIVRAVLNGQLSAEYITDSEMVEVEETVMDLICIQKMEEGKIVFSSVENGMLN